MSLAHSPRIITDGLILALDAGNTKSYPGSGTTWTDVSGRGNTGTLTNGPTYNSSNGGSIVFDGIDDYVEISNNASLNPPSISICAWIYPKTTHIGNFVTKDFNNNYRFRVFSDSSLQFLDRGGTNVCTSNTSYQLNTWIYAVATSTVNSTKMYINGALDSETGNSYGGSITSGVVYIGTGRLSSTPEIFNGNIAQVSIYNRALTASEIQQNFNALRGRFGI